ncbi:hypothetical protein [Nocardioides sp. Root140]|uniref:hypothetical protein n=1 Tax=Nocardioides sp. Root140 TaxID=1736460 RepID=UPI0006F29FA3|nr:hypothetical protein [Nocardioides sp. Root140]KQY57136.1 hypothetical protein ASD30_12865 [Nocardioides sp. Root140]
MTNHHEPGVQDLLHRATGDLTPDVETLVAGGIARGRTRRQRRRVGTTIASVAAVGVIGAGAFVVPQFLEDATPAASSARDDFTSPDVAAAPEVQAQRQLIPTGQMEAVLRRLLPAGVTVTDLTVRHDTDDPQSPADRINFTVDGASVSIYIDEYNPQWRLDKGYEPIAIDDECAQSANCEQTPNGSYLRKDNRVPQWGEGMGPANQVSNDASYWGVDGYRFYSMALNTGAEKGSDGIVAVEPPLTSEQLAAIVSSERWYR